MAQPGALPQPTHLPIPPQQQQSGASLSDILTALKNLVIAISTLTQDYMNVQGLLNAPNISIPTVVKSAGGRLAVVSVISAGTTLGYAYDSVATTARSKTLSIIPNELGNFPVNLPYSFGLLIVPGNGQMVTVSYS